MTKSQKFRVRAFAFVIAAGALLVPVTVSTGSAPVEVNDACADGTCCLELASYCETEDGGLDNYYKTPKKCPSDRM